jgi:predicted nucleotidyltransferase
VARRRTALLAACARAAGRLDRFPPFHAVALAFVAACNRRSFARLAREPAVAAVYVKGSYVRGPFRPLASDVDLALVLRASELATAADARRLLGALRGARRWNPSLRDWWQHLLLDRELPVVRRHWELFGIDEWRDPRGARPFAPERPADLPRLLLAHWSQLCAWSGSAVQAVLHPTGPFHDFRSAIKKTGFLATRLQELAAWRGAAPDADALFALRRRHALAFDTARRPPRGDETSRLAALVALVGDLVASAEVLHARLAAPLLPSARRSGEAPWLRAETGAWCLPPACDGLLVGERTLHVLVEPEIEARALGELLRALRQRDELARPLTFLVPTSALPLWPLPCDGERPRLVARPGTRLAKGGVARPAAAWLREAALFESLFLTSTARLALGFADGEARLRRHAWALARAVRLYEYGEAHVTRAGIASALCADRHALTQLPPALGALLAGSQAIGADELFELCAALGARLFASLERLEPSALVAAEARGAIHG